MLSLRIVSLRIAAATLLCAAPWLAGRALADDDVLRCGSKLITTGVDMQFVLQYCGEPTQRSKEEVPQLGRRANGTTYVTGKVIVEQWIYDRGSSRFPAHLKFEEGKLVGVEFVRP